MEKSTSLRERILEDYQRGGQHEKVFKKIMCFWICAAAVLLIFSAKYYLTPPEFHVVNARYIEDVDKYYVSALYQIDVEAKGRMTEESLMQFTETVMAEYKDEFKESVYLIVYFYDKYQLDEESGEPDRKPLEEMKVYL